MRSVSRPRTWNHWLKLARVRKTSALVSGRPVRTLREAGLHFKLPLGIERVDESQAEAALKSLLKTKPSGYLPIDSSLQAPLYQDPELQKSHKLYQDYLLKHIYVKAGEVGLPIVIHMGVALHPGLRPDWNNPLDMYEVFRDDEIGDEPLIRNAKRNAPLYRLLFASKHSLGHDFWRKVTRRNAYGQKRLF